MFYFRVKGTECLISRHHVIKYKSHWGENASKKGGMKGGGGGGGGGAEVAVVVCKSSWGFAGKETLMLRNKKHM